MTNLRTPVVTVRCVWGNVDEVRLWKNSDLLFDYICKEAIELINSQVEYGEFGSLLTHAPIEDISIRAALLAWRFEYDAVGDENSLHCIRLEAE